MTIFNLGYFQAKFFNGFQKEEEEQQQQQHIDCMDLAIKKEREKKWKKGGRMEIKVQN